jgi:hypothetical protein
MSFPQHDSESREPAFGMNLARTNCRYPLLLQPRVGAALEHLEEKRIPDFRPENATTAKMLERFLFPANMKPL